MAHRLAVVASIALFAALATGCAEQPARGRTAVVHHPLLYRTYAGDLVAPRAPPPFVVEPVRSRRGYVWAHSYWRWDGHDYVAAPGHWEPEQSGSRYVDASWERHRDGWHFRPARWVML
jgi:hypothetical protein